MTLDSLFRLLHDMGGGTAILYPETDDGASRGVVVVVDPVHATEFLDFLRGWQERQFKADDYGWE